MTYLYNEPADFAREATAGFIAANRALVRGVPGGVVRATETPSGQVAVVIGGGSGHYPAFAGLVGQGLAHGAAVGNVFASPSAQQVYSVAKTADRGSGVLLSYGNYTGDVLNFNEAQARLLSEGIPCRSVAVTDDISSAPADLPELRRGIAGNLVVFKVAAAAAESGRPLDAVWEAAARANDRTRSFGVAFDGCMLPGASHPLFRISRGRMALGMGIHGEPGIGESDIPSADELAETLVASVLAEMPQSASVDRGSRVAVLLNGLGAVKYEELFVVYRHIDELLDAAGLTVVEPEVGELVTSLQMAGVSLTLCWLDDALEQMWRMPASTPAYRKGVLPAVSVVAATSTSDREAEVPVEVPVASEASRAVAARMIDVFAAVAAAIDAAAEGLGHLDAVAGDGDHGLGMQRGTAAALEAVRGAVARSAGVGTGLMWASEAWSDRAGGTSGLLWGLVLRAMAEALGDQEIPDVNSVAQGMASAVGEITRHGGAQPGDKTMLDTLLPFAESLAADAAADPFAVAWARASALADDAAARTAQLVPQVGRARLHAGRSLGSPDPGAVSAALVLRAVAQVLNEREV